MIFLSTPDPQRTTPEQAFSNGYANLNPTLLARVATAVTAFGGPGGLAKHHGQRSNYRM